MVSTAVKNALDAVGITNIFAKIDHSNFGLDKIDLADFPVAVFVVPLQQETNWQISGAGRRTVPIQVLFLGRVNDEFDPIADQAYPLIDDMVIKAESFWVNLQKEEGVQLVEDATHDTLWAAFDAHLYGVASVADVEFLNAELAC